MDIIFKVCKIYPGTWRHCCNDIQHAHSKLPMTHLVTLTQHIQCSRTRKCWYNCIYREDTQPGSNTEYLTFSISSIKELVLI
jgi:hypothetical protein